MTKPIIKPLAEANATVEKIDPNYPTADQLMEDWEYHSLYGNDESL